LCKSPGWRGWSLLERIALPARRRWAGYRLIVLCPVLVVVFSREDRLHALPLDRSFCTEVQQSSDLEASRPMAADVACLFCCRALAMSMSTWDRAIGVLSLAIAMISLARIVARALEANGLFFYLPLGKDLLISIMRLLSWVSHVFLLRSSLKLD
jgi:hypothetical protein